MPYCTTDDVQKHISTRQWNHAAVGAEPSDADVTTWCNETSLEIDSKLAGRYNLPITGADALTLLRSICSRLVALRVWSLIFGGSAGEFPQSGAGVPPELKAARTLLNDLAAGHANLPGVTAIAAQNDSPGAPASSFRPLAADPQSGTEAQPTFTMDQQF